MDDTLRLALLLAAAVGSGLVGGLFFAFSTFVMAALDRLPPPHAVAAMQRINETVLNPLFFLAFFGTAVAAAVLAVDALLNRGGPAAAAVAAGAGLYLAGSILVTVAGNVPLNNRLAAVPPDGPDPAARWHAYRRPWTAWNHVRTVASLAAAGAFTLAVRLG